MALRTGSNANKERERMAINVAKLYYQMDYSQLKIAQELGISRPSVSRLLQHAKDNGYVRIQIFDPIEDMTVMEERVQERFNIPVVKIVSATVNDEQEIKKYISKKAAEYLDSIVSDGDVIGVGWGTTMYQVSNSLTPKPLRNSQVVQLEGGVTYSRWRNYARDVLENFANNFSTNSMYLPLPVVFDTKELKRMVDNDRHIKHILDVGKQANIAMFSVGTVRAEALFFRLGYTSEEDNFKRQKEAVGDIYSRFIDTYGNICHPELDQRTVGIDLEELKKKEYSILVAGGEAKLPAIKAALRGGYANVLITDQFTARAILMRRTLESYREEKAYEKIKNNL